MNLLVDTGCWLLSLSAPERLNKRARALLGDPAQVLYLSAASSWEIAIKCGLKKLQLPEPPQTFVPSRMAAFDMVALPVEHAHALKVADLPQHHRDPFDRILIAQAQVESLTILTNDRVFSLYQVPVIMAQSSRR